MKILFAADSSSFTQKALKFLVGNKTMLSGADELVVLHVQDAISAQIERKLGSAEVTAYQSKHADAVLKPIKKFWTNMRLATVACGWPVLLRLKSLQLANVNACK